MSMHNSDVRRKKGVNEARPVAATLCGILLVLLNCGASLEDVARTIDQAELAKIAVEDENRDVRFRAVAKLTDQALLAKIAAEDKDCVVHHVAVGNITDQALLAKYAVEDKDDDVRQSAVAKLTDQTLLAKIAVGDKNWQVRSAATAKLTDQTLLAKIAVGEDTAGHQSATEKLTDQAILAKIAVEDEDWSVRRIAVEKLTDQALLTEMGMWIKPELTQQVSDQILLAKIAVEAKDVVVRRTAVKKLTDQALLAKIAVEDDTDVVCQDAVVKLTNQVLRAMIESGLVDNGDGTVTDVSTGLMWTKLVKSTKKSLLEAKAAAAAAIIGGHKDWRVSEEYELRNMAACYPEHPDILYLQAGEYLTATDYSDETWKNTILIVGIYFTRAFSGEGDAPQVKDYKSETYINGDEHSPFYYWLVRSGNMFNRQQKEKAKGIITD